MSGEQRDRGRDLDSDRERPRVLSEEECELLTFAASRSLVLLTQMRELLGLEDAAVAAQTTSLVGERLLAVGPRLREQAGCYRITRLGLEASGSRLPEPRIDLRGYWREMVAGWVWLRVRAGKYGSTERVYSRREMRAADENPPDLVVEDGVAWSESILAKVSDASFG